MPNEPALQDPLRFHRKTPPCTVVIFGANGDLTKRKLLPALYRLAWEGRLAPGFAVVGISRTAMSHDDFRNHMHDSVAKYLEDSPFDEDLWKSFAQGLFYLAGDVSDAGIYQRLAACLKELDQSRQSRRQCPVLSFHAAQPVCAASRKALARAGLNKGRAGAASLSKSPSGTT